MAFRRALARARSRKGYALTLSAMVGRGAGVVSIQWLIWNIAPDVPPRFGRQEKSFGRWKL